MRRVGRQAYHAILNSLQLHSDRLYLGFIGLSLLLGIFLLVSLFFILRFILLFILFYKWADLLIYSFISSFTYLSNRKCTIILLKSVGDIRQGVHKELVNEC